MVEMLVSPTIQTASIGIQDSIFLMLLALVVFGPRRLPEIGRQIGKLMYEFRKVSNDFKFQMEEELRASEEADRQRKLQAALPAAALPDAAPSAVDVPPQPATMADLAAAEPAEIEPAAAEAGSALEPVAPAAADENAAALPQIRPPSSGEPVAAARPFRASTFTSADDTTTESGSEPVHVLGAPLVVADEGRIGTEVQPGVAGTEVHNG